MRLAAAVRRLQFGNDDHLELQALGFVDGHQLHAAIAAGFGVGQRGELVERRVEGGAEQVFFAAGQAVQATPEQVEVGAGGRIHAGGSAQQQPDLLQPGSQRCARAGPSAARRRRQMHAARVPRRGVRLR